MLLPRSMLFILTTCFKQLLKCEINVVYIYAYNINKQYFLISSFVHPHNSQSIICNQKRHYSQPLKKMLKDTCAKTWLKVFGENYIARCRSQSKHPPQTLSFTFRTCIFNNRYLIPTSKVPSYQDIIYFVILYIQLLNK